MGTNDWRSQLNPESRQRIVNKMPTKEILRLQPELLTQVLMGCRAESLKRHVPVSGEEALNELKGFAMRFEDKIYNSATSQTEYLRKISLKMLTMESKYQRDFPNGTPSNNLGDNNSPADQGASMQN